MKAGAFGRAPERRQVQPGGRVLPGMFASASSSSSSPQSSMSTPASKPAATPSAVLSRWGSGEASGSGRFSGGSAGGNGSSRLDRLTRTKDEGLSGRESSGEDRPQPKSLASSDSIARARRLGLNRRVRTPSPEPEASEEEAYERSPSPPPVRRQRAQSTSASAFTRTRPQTRAESLSPPRPQHRRRASSPPPVAAASFVPSLPPAEQSTPPAHTTSEQPAQGFLGSLWGRASQLVSSATGAGQTNGVKELAPSRKDSVTSDLPVPESHITPFGAAGQDEEEHNRKPTRPLVVPPLVAAALAPHEAASVQPLLLRTQSAPNPTVSPITYHRPTSLHARDSQRSSTSRFRSQPTPFDWLDPHRDLPLEPYLFLRSPAEKTARRGGAGRAARAPRPVSAMTAGHVQPMDGNAAPAAIGGLAGAASVGLLASSAGPAGHSAASALHSHPALAPPPLIAPHFISSPPPPFGPPAPTAPMPSPPPPPHHASAAPPVFAPPVSAPPSTSAPPPPQLYAPAVAAAMTTAPPAATSGAASFAPFVPPPLVAPAWQPISQAAQPAPLEPRSTAEPAAESPPAYEAPPEVSHAAETAAASTAPAGRAAPSGASAEEGEPGPSLPRSGAGPDSLPTFPAPTSTAAPPLASSTAPPLSAAAAPVSSYGPPVPPASPPHPPQAVSQPAPHGTSAAAPSALPPLVPPAPLSGSAALAPAPAAVGVASAATMPAVVGGPAPLSAAPAATGSASSAAQGGMPLGGPALPHLPSLSRLLPAANRPTQPPSVPSTSAPSTSSALTAPATIPSVAAPSNDLPPMPKPRPIPLTPPPQPPVPPVMPSASILRADHRSVVPSSDPPVLPAVANPTQQPVLPPLVPPPLPPKPPGYAARQVATTPVPARDAATSPASPIAGAMSPAVTASVQPCTVPHSTFSLTAITLASATPLPPSPAPPSYASPPIFSSLPLLADSKDPVASASNANGQHGEGEAVADQSSREPALANIQIADIHVEPPTPIMPQASPFRLGDSSLLEAEVPAAEEGETQAEQELEAAKAAASSGVEALPAIQPLELGCSLPDLGSLAFSPVATSAPWDVESVTLAEAVVSGPPDKSPEPLPLPDMIDSPPEDEPDPLDEAFNAVTAFASSFAQADLARAAQDPNHTERTERWLQRQGIERRPLSAVQAATAADEATSRVGLSQESLSPGIYRPQTAPPASVPLCLSTSMSTPAVSSPSTTPLHGTGSRGVSLAASLARLAAVSERDSAEGLSAEPPSPLETSVGAIGTGQLDRPRALDGGGTDAGEGFWVQRKIERQVEKAKPDAAKPDEAKSPALSDVALGGGTEMPVGGQHQVKSEDEEAAEVAALFANW